MLDALKRLISPEYLVVAEPGPLGGLWRLYLALGALFAAGLGAALWLLFGPRRDTRSPALRAWAWFELWICLAGLGTVVGRFLAWPGWSARIWPYSLALLAIAGTVAYWVRHVRLPAWLAVQLRILSLRPIPEARPHARPSAYFPTQSRPASYLPFLLGLVVHLAGIGFILSERARVSYWLAPLILLVLLLPQAPLLARRLRPKLMALSPLLLAYAAALLVWFYQQLGVTIIGWQGLLFPNPMTSAFYLDGIMLAMIAFAILCQLGVVAAELGGPSLLWRAAVAGLLLATLVWAGIVYFGKRTHGATASDPFAYAQMGVDLAQEGTFLHRYALFEDVMPLNIAWAPLQPVGYHIPRNEQGDCPSVWATGASAFLAAGTLLLGEVGLYITIPIVALLALAATWWLVQELLCDEARAIRYLTGALAVTLLATSPEHVDRLLVPMADAPAQLFTLLTLVFALRGMRQLGQGRSALWSFALSGLSFGLAYWVRHTQLVLVLPVLTALWLGTRAPVGSPQKGASTPPLSARLRAILLPLLVFGGAALIAALPDIVYRWQIFGGPLATETTELHLMHPAHIGPVAWQMLRDSLASGEWGYLFPLAVYGAYRLARDRRREALVLGAAFVAVLLVHLTYRSLRLRDLISLFPLLDLAVACGAVSLVRLVWSLVPKKRGAARLGAGLLPAVVFLWIILSLGLSRWAMLDNLWKPGWASFGYMRVEQRAAFDRLAELTPPEGIIGASLNAGAVMMYTDRDAIRPYDSWTHEEWQLFLEAMRELDRPIYLLDDGSLMADFIAQQREGYHLTPIEELSIPLFYTQDRDTGWLYRLEWAD